MNPEEENKNGRPKYRYDPYTGEYLGEPQAEESANPVEEEKKPANDGFFDDNDGSSNYFYSQPSSENYYIGKAYRSESDNGENSGGGEKQNKVLGIVSMSLGIVSILAMCGCGISIMFGIAAIILAAIQMKRGTNGFAIAGLITGIAGIILGVFSIFFTIFFQSSGIFEEEFWSEYENFIRFLF